MSILNVMKTSEKKASKIHVVTKSYENPGGAVQLLFSEDFSTLTILIKGKQDAVIKLSKDNTKVLTKALGEGMI